MRGKNKIAINREEFEKAYLEDLLTYAEIAEKFHCGTSVVAYRIKEWGLQRTEEQRSKCISKGKTIYRIEEEEFKKAFLEENLTLEQMAERFQTTIHVIRHKLKDWGIKKPRQLSNANGRHPRLNIPEEELKKLYINQLKSPEEISKIYGCHSSTILKYLKIFNISRTKEQNQAKKQETCKKKYGATDYKRKNWPPHTEEILQNREKFEEFIKEITPKTTENIANRLGCSIPVVDRKILQYKLRYLIEEFTSQGERWVNDLLDKIGVNHYKTRQIIPPYEIDCYCPDYKIGIEFNGSYWHSVEKRKTDYHLQKFQLAKDKDVFILHIYESDWLCKRGKKRIELFIRNLFSNKAEEFFKKLVLCTGDEGMYVQPIGLIPEWVYNKLGLTKIAQSPPSQVPNNICKGEVYDCGHSLWVKNNKGG